MSEYERKWKTLAQNYYSVLASLPSSSSSLAHASTLSPCHNLSTTSLSLPLSLSLMQPFSHLNLFHFLPVSALPTPSPPRLPLLPVSLSSPPPFSTCLPPSLSSSLTLSSLSLFLLPACHSERWRNDRQAAGETWRRDWSWKRQSGCHGKRDGMKINEKTSSPRAVCLQPWNQEWSPWEPNQSKKRKWRSPVTVNYITGWSVHYLNISFVNVAD